MRKNLITAFLLKGQEQFFSKVNPVKPRYNFLIVYSIIIDSSIHEDVRVLVQTHFEKKVYDFSYCQIFHDLLIESFAASNQDPDEKELANALFKNTLAWIKNLFGDDKTIQSNYLKEFKAFLNYAPPLKRSYNTEFTLCMQSNFPKSFALITKN
jgi:hypothetical protein